MPAHFGRRCTGQVKSLTERGVYERCDYRWTCKECPKCDEPNDIAARFCSSCKCEILDPNARLMLEYTRIKKDPYSVSTDKVLSWKARVGVSNSGKEVLVCDISTEYRSFSVWFTPSSKHPAAIKDWILLNSVFYRGHIAPDAETFLKNIHKGDEIETITYAREKGSKFYRVFGYNNAPDEEPSG